MLGYIIALGRHLVAKLLDQPNKCIALVHSCLGLVGDALLVGALRLLGIIGTVLRVGGVLMEALTKCNMCLCRPSFHDLGRLGYILAMMFCGSHAGCTLVHIELRGKKPSLP
jgi:hypothetical protein